MLSTFTRPTLIEVVTPRCVECRAMKPDLDTVAAEYDSVDLVIIDATQEAQRVADLRVMGTPTLIAVRDGMEAARFTGRRSRNELRQMFAAVAAGEPEAISRFGRGDRTVWTVAGGAVAIAGLAIGPSWPIVLGGAAIAGYANLR